MKSPAEIQRQEALERLRKAKEPKPDKKKHWLKPFSPKRTEENKDYQIQSKAFLAAHPICQIKSPVCTGKAQGIHHRAGRIGKLLMNILFWMSACNRCNLWVEENDSAAREKGLKVTKHQKPTL